MKGVIEELAAGLYIKDLVMEPGNHASFQPGRTARVLLSKQQIGWLGEVHPLVIDAYGIRGGWPVVIQGEFDSGSVSVCVELSGFSVTVQLPRG